MSKNSCRLLILILFGGSLFGCGQSESSRPADSAMSSPPTVDEGETASEAAPDAASDEPAYEEEAEAADEAAPDVQAYSFNRRNRELPEALPEEAADEVAREEPMDLAPEPAGPSRVELVSKELRFVKVFYGTNRKRNAAAEGLETTTWDNDVCTPNDFYGSEVAIMSDLQSDQSGLEVGMLTVSFPPKREKGKIQRPTTIFSFDLRKEDPERDVVIANLTSYAHDFDRWTEELKNTGRKQACIYVHGFANSFATAARRAAQLAYDLDYDLDDDFQGLTMMYSWPSKNGSSLAAYLIDSDASDTSAGAFNLFLDLIKQQAGISRVHVIAHSMGNRLVAEALTQRGAPQPMLDQLVLAAPDLWTTAFRNEYRRSLTGFADRVTLYVSDNDRALQASSKLLRGSEPRVGQAAAGLLEEQTADNFDAIDATSLTSDFLGHSYYAENQSMLSDIYWLLKGRPANDRPLIEHHPQWPSWRFRSLDSSLASTWTNWLLSGAAAIILVALWGRARRRRPSPA